MVAWLLMVVAIQASEAPEAPTPVVLVPQLGHSRAVKTAAFSADGARVVSAGADGTAAVWDARTGALLHRLAGHSSSLTSAAFSADGARVVTASEDATAAIWDARTGAPLHRLAGHGQELTSAAFSPDGARVVTASADHTAAVWDARTGALLHRLEGHGAGVEFAAFSRDGERVVTASADRTAGVWDARTGALLHRLPHTDWVWAAAFSPDSRRVLTVGEDGAAVWDVGSGASLHRLEGHTGVGSGAFSPDGARVVTASVDGAAVVWDADSGALVHHLQGHTAQIRSVAFSPNGTRVVTASDDRTAAVWDAGSGALLLRLEGHAGTVWAAAFSRDGGRVLTASGDGAAAVWDAGTGALVRRLAGHARSLASASFSPEGARVITASEDATAAIWDARTGAPHRLEAHAQGLTFVASSPDGRRAVTASSDHTAAVWDADSGALLHRLVGHRSVVESAAFSPDGGRLVTASRDGAAAVWDAGTGALLHRLEGGTVWVLSAAFSPDGSRVVTQDAGGAGAVWDAGTGALLHRLEGPPDSGAARSATSARSIQDALERAVNLDGSAEFSPDGTRVVTASSAGIAAVWDANGALVHRLEGSAADFAASSPDGERVVTGASDGTVTVWDAVHGTPLHRLRAHARAVTSAAFSPDGSRVVTASADGTAAVWDAVHGTSLHRLEGHAGALVSAEFSPDGSRVLTASADGTARLWDGQTGAPLATLLTFDDGTWAVVDPTGRFDTEDAGTLRGAIWERPFDPDRGLLLTTFAKAYYTPGLLRSIWSGQPLEPVPDILDLNVLTPTVALTSTTEGDHLTVSAEVCTRTDTLPMRDGPRRLKSRAHDLQLFLNGHLVAEQAQLPKGCSTHRFTVPVPAGTDTVELSAYAFNVDDIKSDTATLTVTNPRARQTPHRRAFLVTVGVDDYAGLGFGDLRWAGADADALSDALAHLPDHEVHRVVLATGGAASPTRANLQAILATLAGAPAPAWAPDFTAAGPDDLVLVTYSGHGYAPKSGEFYLVLSDLGRTGTADPDGALPYAVSESDLAAWLKPIRAGELALIVDACQSAASVEGEGFKAGPLGSKGFGQLAYDKGMLVLAASQKDSVALESGNLGHGLLTYALVEDGLGQDLADTDGTPGITLREWLKYAEGRVQELTGAVARGEAIGRSHAVECRDAECIEKGLARLGEKPAAQVPRLFAFKGGGATVIAP